MEKQGLYPDLKQNPNKEFDLICAVLNLSVVSDSVIPWTAAYKAQLSMGILQVITLEWVAMPFSSGSPQPRDGIQVSCVAGWFFTNWATREATLYIHLKYVCVCIYIYVCVWMYMYIHKHGQNVRDGEGQGGQVCCSPWGHKESDMTGWLNRIDTYQNLNNPHALSGSN